MWYTAMTGGSVAPNSCSAHSLLNLNSTECKPVEQLAATPCVYPTCHPLPHNSSWSPIWNGNAVIIFVWLYCAIIFLKRRRLVFIWKVTRTLITGRVSYQNSNFQLVDDKESYVGNQTKVLCHRVKKTWLNFFTMRLCQEKYNRVRVHVPARQWPGKLSYRYCWFQQHNIIIIIKS